MTKQEFIKSVKDGIHSNSLQANYTSPQQYEMLIKSFIWSKWKGVVVPSPYNNGRFKGLEVYLEEIWRSNCHIFSSADATAKAAGQRGPSTYTSTSLKLTKDKAGVENGYSSLLASLRDTIASFERLDIKNPELRQVNNNLISKLKVSLKNISEEKEYVLRHMSWDKLVIGFFGETNAGKSTIIESLRILLNETSRNAARRNGRKTDGEIVGDGQSDFTQDYHEYTMTVDGQTFVLIDVPGIEGKENLYKGKIGEALRKAHMIFFVNGSNKPLDGGTASKIKEYMGEGVKVNVIQNVRGNIDGFEYPEDRQTFITNGVKTVLTGLDNQFRALLGNRYNKSVAVQGLLSMCSYAEFSPSRTDLEKKQRRLISFFGEDCGNNASGARERIRRFSHIDDVISLIRERSRNFKAEIAEANFIKLEQFCSASLKEFIAIVDNDRMRFESYKRRVSQFQNDNWNIGGDYATQFENEALSETSRILNEFVKEANRLIELSSFSSLETQYKATKQRIENRVKELGRTYTTKLATEVNARARNLSNIPGFTGIGSSMLADFNINVNFNVDAIRDEDDISFGDVCTSVGSTVGGATTGAIVGGILGSIIPIVGNAIGAWIGGSVGGGAGLVSGNVKAGENQTQRAKEKAQKLIANARSEYNKAIKEKADEFRRNANSNVRQVNHLAGLRINEIDAFYQCTNDAESKLRVTLSKIKIHE